MQRYCRVLLGQSSISDSQKDSENVCCTQMSPHFSLFPGKMDFEFSVPKTKGTIQTFISNRSKSQRLSWYGVQQRHMCEGTIDVESYIGIIQRYIYCLQEDVFNGKFMVIRSRQCQLSLCMCYNSVVS